MFPREIGAATFRSRAKLIPHEVSVYLGYSPLPLLDRLIDDAQKIQNTNRSCKRRSLPLRNQGVSRSYRQMAP